uniref:Uncharacterized protein n=1 Tax=Oryza brachyantha TaxID=4533 RepID=J3M1D1_ORYBR
QEPPKEKEKKTALLFLFLLLLFPCLQLQQRNPYPNAAAEAVQSVSAGCKQRRMLLLESFPSYFLSVWLGAALSLSLSLP